MRERVQLLVISLCVVLPTAARAVCGGGGISSVPAPAVAYLRSYRAPLQAPTRLAVDASGNVYVTDPPQGQVLVRAPNGHIVSTVRHLGRPVSIAVSANGRRYVGDAATGSVTAFSADWQPVLQLGQGAGEFLLPSDLSVDAVTGNIYVADSTAHLIKVYDSTGTFVQSFGGHGSDDGQFSYPVGVFVDAIARQVWVTDQLNYRIQVFDVAGTFVSCFGGQGSGGGKFDMPQGVVIDGLGRVYVADSVEGRIQVLDRNGDFVGYIGDFGDAAAQLRIPVGMVIDPSNRLLVAAANNARLEVFGLDAFADPETIAPAVLHVEPNPLERAAPAGVIAAYLEVPGYGLDQIVPTSVVANGVPATTTPFVLGDHDNNGVPDARIEFDWTALLATLPATGNGTVSLSGLVGTLQFEAAAPLQVTLCGPSTRCPLGDADPQCNTAVCLADVGCAIAPKVDGTGCEDGNACTIDDACTAGSCIGTALNCTDNNLCTDDSCDPVTGCVFADNSAPCDDGNACTTADTCAAGTCSGAPLICDDGNGCTDDSCDPATGCVSANNTLPCDDANPCTVNDTCAAGVCGGTALSCDDGNVCTDDTCNPASGCVHTSNSRPCNDGNPCTGPDTCAATVCSGPPLTCDDGNVCTDDACDPSTGCVHTGNTHPCDDADPGTLDDVCNGAGTCSGRTATGHFAILRWPLAPPKLNATPLGGNADIRGDVCTSKVQVKSFSKVEGDLSAWAASGRAITFGRTSQVTGDVATGGGAVLGTKQASIGGMIDLSGSAAGMSECFAARYRATNKRAEFAALPVSPGLALGAIQLASRTTRRIPATGTLEAGQSVIDLTRLRLGAGSTLILAGTAATDTVIVHIHGSLMIGRGAAIETAGIPAERVILVVDGVARLQSNAHVTGSVFAAGSVRLGWASSVTGAVMGNVIQVAPFATVDLHGFVAW